MGLRLERRREHLHDGLAEIDGLGVGVLGLHGAAASGGRHELGRHVQLSVLGLEHGAHMREIIDAHAGREAPLAARAGSRTEADLGHDGIGVLVDEQRESLELLLDLGRHAHGERHQRRVVGGPGRVEHHHAVLGADRPVAESLLLEPDPIVLVGDRHEGLEGEGRSGNAARQGQALERKRHGAVLLRASLAASYHSHSSSAKAAETLRT